MSSREQERKALRLIPYPSPAARSMISCGDVQRRIACCRSEQPSHADTQERRTLKSASGREEEEGGCQLDSRVYNATKYFSSIITGKALLQGASATA